MRTPVGWTLCACCALWGTSAAAHAAPEQITSTTAVSTAASDNSARAAHAWLDRRVLTLLAMGCLVGVIAGWASGGPRETRLRLLKKPKKARLSVLVSPGPAPRLIPGDSPHATRSRWARAQVSRQTPIGDTHPRVLHYFAPFADAAAASEDARVDYLLESDEADAPTESN